MLSTNTPHTLNSPPPHLGDYLIFLPHSGIKKKKIYMKSSRQIFKLQSSTVQPLKKNLKKDLCGRGAIQGLW